MRSKELRFDRGVMDGPQAVMISPQQQPSVVAVATTHHGYALAERMAICRLELQSAQAQGIQDRGDGTERHGSHRPSERSSDKGLSKLSP